MTGVGTSNFTFLKVGFHHPRSCENSRFSRNNKVKTLRDTDGSVKLLSPFKNLQRDNQEIFAVVI